MKKAISVILSLCLIPVMGVSAIVIASKPDEEKASDKLIDIEISNDSIILQHNGMSEFIEIAGIYKNGKAKDLKKEVSLKTADQEIAIAIEGRVLARGKGSTEIIVTYGNIEKIISVEVLENIDLEALMRQMASDRVSTRSLTTAEREAIISKASAMYNVSWTPTETLLGFEYKVNEYWTYTTSGTYNIPYSQSVNQVDEDEFEDVVDDNDFYDAYERYLGSPYNRIVEMPKYGVDCSAYVSYAWGVSRETSASFITKIQNSTYPKAGSYNAVNYSNNIDPDDLMDSYPSMQSADAVVHTGHVMLIGDNYSTFAFVYEQAGPEIELTYWTHEDLKDELYMPFAKE